VVAIFGVVVGYQAIGGPEGIRGGRGQESKLISRQTAVRMILVAVLYAALILLPFADRRGIAVLADNLVGRWFGLVLVSLGFGLVYWSGWLLGRQYSPEVTIQKGHELITAGVYRRIRHPRYLGVMLLALGMSLLFRSWAGLGLTLPLTGVLLFRMRDEESLMHKEFGQEWEAYCRRSWRLVPFCSSRRLMRPCCYRSGREYSGQFDGTGSGLPWPQTRNVPVSWD